MFNTLYRCPEDKTRDPKVYSYALNVHLELDPDNDDYLGEPTTWNRASSVPAPARTILLAETSGSADHLMCHWWESAAIAATEVDGLVHGKKTSNYVFADGHVESLPFDQTYDPGKNLNLWNPSLAGAR